MALADDCAVQSEGCRAPGGVPGPPGASRDARRDAAHRASVRHWSHSPSSCVARSAHHRKPWRLTHWHWKGLDGRMKLKPTCTLKY